MSAEQTASMTPTTEEIIALPPKPLDTNEPENECDKISISYGFDETMSNITCVKIFMKVPTGMQMSETDFKQFMDNYRASIAAETPEETDEKKSLWRKIKSVELPTKIFTNFFGGIGNRFKRNAPINPITGGAETEEGILIDDTANINGATYISFLIVINKNNISIKDTNSAAIANYMKSFVDKNNPKKEITVISVDALDKIIFEERVYTFIRDAYNHINGKRVVHKSSGAASGATSGATSVVPSNTTSGDVSDTSSVVPSGDVSDTSSVVPSGDMSDTSSVVPSGDKPTNKDKLDGGTRRRRQRGGRKNKSIRRKSYILV